MADSLLHRCFFSCKDNTLNVKIRLNSVDVMVYSTTTVVIYIKADSYGTEKKCSKNLFFSDKKISDENTDATCDLWDRKNMIEK